MAAGRLHASRRACGWRHDQRRGVVNEPTEQEVTQEAVVLLLRLRTPVRSGDGEHRGRD
ncbi:hypothetical protein HPP92_018448 [Vanilla planifolia]|uniref:Uncharacterized protein n=1 Tax=Vanilla planifolia TaxID=51239 RepID=A0A835UMF1_VANPL|nr:hypothetical protein HPP92_018448 [Vanilla planifolia]